MDNSDNEINKFGESIGIRPWDDSERGEQQKINFDMTIGAQVEAVCEAFGIIPKEIYVPGSSNQVLPNIDVLQDSHILYADLDERVVKDLKEAGYNAIVADVEAVVPPMEIDLLILNGITVDKPLQSVKKGGIIFSDGRMGSAENIAKRHQEFKLVGVVIEEPQVVQGDTQIRKIVRKDGLESYVTELRRTEQEHAEIRKKIRMELMNENTVSNLEKSSSKPPRPVGYIFQK